MRLFTHTFILLFFVFLTASLPAQIVINEYSAANLYEFVDQFGKTEDWVEFYNTTDSPVDMSGWFFSDKSSNPEKWAFPAGTMIEANGFLVVYCSGRDIATGGEIHTSFKLSQTKNNEWLVLSQPNGLLVNSYELNQALLHDAWARPSDGAPYWVIVTDPTPGQSNNTSVQYTRYTQQPEINLTPGFYQDSVVITISSNETDGELRYTLDGSTPTESSNLYNGPITITNTTVVKARSISTNSLVLDGKVAFATYFIDESFTLPVFSVAADDVQDLANGMGSLRPIGSCEYFEDGVFVDNAYGDLNRHGQDSWINPHRSLDWVSRDEMAYSRNIEAELFEYSDRDKFQRLMFRASGDDNYPAINDFAHEGSAHMRDEYVHILAQEGGLDLDVRAVRRVILFLNGDYWGVYGLRERPVDHDYTKYYYDQTKYELQYLLTWGNTWDEYGGMQAFDDWGALRDFIMDNDMSDSANYAYVTSQMRVQSLMDYMITNLNAVSSDWINYNTGWWRGLNPEGGRLKWGYILWDNDATFDYYINYSGVPNTNPDAVPCDINDIADFMDNFFGGNDVGKHEQIFLKLQDENEDFRNHYYARQADLMNEVFSCENMLATLDAEYQKILPEMPRQIARWGGTMAEWQSNYNDLKAFIEARCELIDDGLRDCFDLTGPYALTVQVSPPEAGLVDLNTISLDDFPWTGDYFGNMPNSLTAKEPASGYVFSHWESSTGHQLFPDSTALSIDVNLTGADTLTAVFQMITGVNELEVADYGLRAFPIPTDDALTLSFELPEAGAAQLELMSIQGAHIAHIPMRQNRFAAGLHQQNLSLAPYQLASGLYFLRLKTDQGQQSVKINVVR